MSFDRFSEEIIEPIKSIVSDRDGNLDWNKIGAHAALLGIQLAFSGWYIVGSLTMGVGANPYVFVLYRECIASTLMFGYAKYCGVQIRVDKEDRQRFAVLGFFSFINVVGAMLALVYMSPNRFAIFQPSIPCIGTMISIVLGMETATKVKIIAVALAVAGAIIATAWSDSSEGSEEDEITGIFIVVAQVISFACLLVFQKPILHKYHPANVNVIYYSIGAIYTVLLCIAWSFTFTATTVSFSGLLLPWLAIAYSTTFATLYPYNAYSWSGQYVSPSTTTVYSTFQPIATILLSLLILGTVVTLPEGLGAALVILGLSLNVWSHRNEVGEAPEGATDKESSGIDGDQDSTSVYNLYDEQCNNDTADHVTSSSTGRASEGIALMISNDESELPIQATGQCSSIHERRSNDITSSNENNKEIVSTTISPLV